MVNYTIALCAFAVRAAARRLILVQKQGNYRPVQNAERELNLETRSLLNRYINLVLWTGERDQVTRNYVRDAIKIAVKKVGKSETSSASAIRLRLQEFNNFACEVSSNKSLTSGVRSSSD